MSEKHKDQIIHWVTGKGGVGKSTIAAAMAMSLARSGYKTLLVELGGKSFFKYVFEKEIGHAPMELDKNFSIALWDGPDCLREYLLHLIKLERVVQLFFENRVMKSLVGAAPGLRELALVGKITSGIRGVGPSMPYDCLVIDSFATGHFRTLLESPRAMAEAIPLGPMGEQSRSTDNVLRSASSRYHIVVTPEELPVTEGLELASFVRKMFGADPELILNRWLNPPVTLEELRRLPATEFTRYLDFLIERQERLQVEIQSQTKHTKCVPYSWEFSANERIERLSKFWDQAWN